MKTERPVSCDGSGPGAWGAMPIGPTVLITLFLLLASRSILAAQAQVGQTAPAIELPSLLEDGKPLINLDSLRGKVVYLDFWASWCGPCRVSFPLLDELRRDLGPQGFEVLAVGVDEFEKDAIRFVREFPVSYPVVLDATGETPGRYGILGMPTGFLLDRKGVIRLMHQGFHRQDVEKLRVHILQLLDSPE